jgi:hypothetical protein
MVYDNDGPIYSALMGKPPSGFAGAGYYLSTEGATISGSNNDSSFNGTYRVVKEYDSNGDVVGPIGGPNGGSIWYAQVINGANAWNNGIQKYSSAWEIGSFLYLNPNVSSNVVPTTGWREFCPNYDNSCDPATSLVVSIVSFNDIIPDYIF